MFVDRPLGDPLKRKQLKWLLLVLGVIMIIAILLLSFRLMKEPVQDPAQPMSPDKGTAQGKPTQEDVQKQLEMLAKEDAANSAPKPTQEEIQKQLEALAAEDAKNPAPKPTQEEIAKQLEALSKQ
ncbi:MAG: hypothetical protein KBD19_01050 [Candidatus Moranbacteria bacterium]|nr:hypothetical protein [Candidatus Moranbacteria bacterium]